MVWACSCQGHFASKLIFKEEAMLNPMKAFGAAIRTMRKERHLTQENLAELCERHPVYISEIERGIKNPSLDSILRLCQALKITPGSLMDLAFQPIGDMDVMKKQICRMIDGQDAKKIKMFLEIARVFWVQEDQ
jgi:transcriptional regulator with XRE-family HTH domain